MIPIREWKFCLPRPKGIFALLWGSSLLSRLFLKYFCPPKSTRLINCPRSSDVFARLTTRLAALFSLLYYICCIPTIGLNLVLIEDIVARWIITLPASRHPRRCNLLHRLRRVTLELESIARNPLHGLGQGSGLAVVALSMYLL